MKIYAGKLYRFTLEIEYNLYDVHEMKFMKDKSVMIVFNLYNSRAELYFMLPNFTQKEAKVAILSEMYKSVHDIKDEQINMLFNIIRESNTHGFYQAKEIYQSQDNVEDIEETYSFEYDTDFYFLDYHYIASSKIAACIVKDARRNDTITSFVINSSDINDAIDYAIKQLKKRDIEILNMLKLEAYNKVTEYEFYNKDDSEHYKLKISTYKDGNVVNIMWHDKLRGKFATSSVSIDEITKEAKKYLADDIEYWKLKFNAKFGFNSR